MRPRHRVRRGVAGPVCSLLRPVTTGLEQVLGVKRGLGGLKTVAGSRRLPPAGAPRPGLAVTGQLQASALPAGRGDPCRPGERHETSPGAAPDARVLARVPALLLPIDVGQRTGPRHIGKARVGVLRKTAGQSLPLWAITKSTPTNMRAISPSSSFWPLTICVRNASDRAAPPRERVYQGLLQRVVDTDIAYGQAGTGCRRCHCAAWRDST